MAKYQQYNEYKDSGVEWLGEIPKDWEMWKIAHAYLEIGSGTTPPSSNEEWYVGDIPWVTTGELREKLILDTKKKVSKKTIKAFPTLRIYPVGSIAIAMYGATIGRLGILGVEATTNQACCVMSQSNVIFNKFLYYWMQAFKDDIVRLSSGGGQPNINQETVASLKVSTPRHKEQVQIANFLDHETAQIDTLIEKQQTLIQLLKEKRKAVISHAVTKGLNPDAPMKDSGVEWLGSVPEHWVVAQLKFNTLMMQTGPFGSQLHAEEYIEDGIPLINPAHMIDGDIVPDNRVTVDKATQERLERHKLSEGDIIFARRGELGRCAIVHKYQEGWICGTGSLRATLNDKLISEYAYLLITSDGLISELSLESKGSTMDNLNTETLGRVRMPVPPRNEQYEIISHVSHVFGKYKVLVENAARAIQLMQERRTALISAAVTGKIDVRGWRAADNKAS
ncbi:restriction endonuclease subunit S [Psychrobacter okhotskensis]|uniref:restriction endonuclease subunit S n=1 Tax=Psychrobacter okhotskensis TaxID=212403 RepID=UPI003D0362F2